MCKLGDAGEAAAGGAANNYHQLVEGSSGPDGDYGAVRWSYPSPGKSLF